MNRNVLWGILAAGLLLVAFNTFFVVDQREQAIVLRLGEPVRVIHAPGQGGAGLNMKTPFVENVIRFDRRNLALEADQEEVTASDQQRLVVDAFLRYRIADPLQYYRTLRDENTAQDRLERLVNSSLRQVLGSTTTSDIISGRRDQLMAASKLDVARRAQQSRLGIEVIDLRIKRADLPAANLPSVYRRMQTGKWPSPSPPPRKKARPPAARATLSGPASSPRASAAIRASRPSTGPCRPMRPASARATPPWCSPPTAPSSATSNAAPADGKAG